MVRLRATETTSTRRAGALTDQGVRASRTARLGGRVGERALKQQKGIGSAKTDSHTLSNTAGSRSNTHLKPGWTNGAVGLTGRRKRPRLTRHNNVDGGVRTHGARRANSALRAGGRRVGTKHTRCVAGAGGVWTREASLTLGARCLIPKGKPPGGARQLQVNVVVGARKPRRATTALKSTFGGKRAGGAREDSGSGGGRAGVARWAHGAVRSAAQAK